MSSSLILLILTLSAFIGGIVGFALFNWLFLKNREAYVILSDEKLSEEIVNIRSRIQVIYVIGPLIGLGLGIFGLNSFDKFDKKIETQVSDLLKKHEGKINEIDSAYKKSQSINNIVSFDDLETLSLASKNDLNDIKTNFEKYVRNNFVSDLTFNDRVIKKVRSNGYMEEQEIEKNIVGPKIQSFYTDRIENTFSTLTQLRDGLKEKLDNTYSSRIKLMEQNIESFKSERSDYLKSSNLSDYSIVTESYLGSYLKIGEFDNQLKVSAKTVAIEKKLDALAKENQELEEKLLKLIEALPDSLTKE
ncbi:hypothetical protein FNH22_23550 [Fulvivirga sp. M361]|uniref:hypothetical protein n=1 Tax=Fulvivirga sp. M361 TaxID=2594266 RepID=UPI00117AC3DC|nr:hypothetical protein [Fulvivirga sp. M361]TRX51741.1 hypothetical protein FNH22_23550 [Fulvivirga sp. M361]